MLPLQGENLQSANMSIPGGTAAQPDRRSGLATLTSVGAIP